MYKKTGMLFAFFMLICASAHAHVMNKKNVFEDLALTKAADEIVLLYSLGIVSYLDDNYEFKPNEILTAKDLAAWTASYYGLQGETSEELAKAALKEGIITRITGNATYQLVNEVYFHSKLKIDNPDETLTREQFALFVASNVKTNIDGHTLLDMSGFTEGPTGTIDSVEQVKKQTVQGSNVHIYILTIDGIDYEFGMHPCVIADSVDPSVWVGESVSESYFGPNVATDSEGLHSKHHLVEKDDHSNHSNDSKTNSTTNEVSEMGIQFLVIGEEPFTPKIQTIETTSSSESFNSKNLETNSIESSMLDDAMEKEQSAEDSLSTWIYIVTAILIVGFIALVLMIKRID